MRIEFTVKPDFNDIDFLTRKINDESPDYDDAYNFVFFIRDENEKIIAGCNGSVIFGIIYTDQLWVHPDHREQGLARKLMMRVHEFGRIEKCSMATVSTMDFQNAVSFYQKLGYEIEFEKNGYAIGAKCFSLSKKL